MPSPKDVSTSSPKDVSTSSTKDVSTSSQKDGKNADVNWKEEGDHVQINISAAGKDIKLRVVQPCQNFFEITIPKQKDPVTGQQTSDGEGQKPQDGGDKQTKGEKTKEEESDKQKKEGDKSKEGSGKQTKEVQEPKRDETMVEKVMTNLKAYKGIVITAFIAISLGFLVRRKFKAAGH